MITESGMHENVAGLVYIAAFAPGAGESVNTLIATDDPVIPPATRSTSPSRTRPPASSSGPPSRP